MEMTKQEQIEIIINKSCNENAIALSGVEIAVIALDLLKSRLFENKIPVADIEQGDMFKWGNNEYIKLDTLADGCLCLAKDVWFNSKFDDDTNNWARSQLRGDIGIKANYFIPDTDKLKLFDRDLLTDDGLIYYGYCTDSVSMLTCDEYRKYREYIPTTSERYWTITASTTRDCGVRYVDTDGSLDGSDALFGSYGVRPLICLDKETLVEVEE